ncbi:hypothetical protein SKAU_G00344050 [Synaphobranchus kaupii]|uniref:Uncharacterized protein n=1 Tax=Synaphobranchus kaupii TaxID=118154 RepID=A0A9Q1EJ71_SYNKA|nr:hypothetical protein SKAU_G00344050 [Synaphobranchus kaupii]
MALPTQTSAVPRAHLYVCRKERSFPSRLWLVPEAGAQVHRDHREVTDDKLPYRLSKLLPALRINPLKRGPTQIRTPTSCQKVRPGRIFTRLPTARSARCPYSPFALPSVCSWATLRGHSKTQTHLHISAKAVLLRTWL